MTDSQFPHEKTESAQRVGSLLPLHIHDNVHSSLLWMKLNIKSEKEPVQTEVSLPANKLCPLLSTQ